MSARKSLAKYIWSALLALLLAGCATGSIVQTPAASSKTSRLPDPNEVKVLLVQIVDVEKRVPGIVVGMIAAHPGCSLQKTLPTAPAAPAASPRPYPS